MITVDIKFKQDDITKMVNNLQNISTSMKVNAGHFLTEIAQNIMAESKNEVPVETGNLKSSAYITAPMQKANGSTVVKMGYGGLNDKKRTKPDKYTGEYKMASEYALAQHEIKYKNHRIGKWKYLEDPLRRQIKNFNQILVAQMRALIQKGGTLKGVR